jgi:hypothetical protein
MIPNTVRKVRSFCDQTSRTSCRRNDPNDVTDQPACHS